MDRIVVDDAFRSQMASRDVPCLVVDAHGTELGYFTPALDKALYENVGPSVDDEELARRETAGGGRSLSEVWADLERQH